MRGYFAVGIYGGKTPENLGTLWRTASLYDAAFIFTVGKRYVRQASDTPHVSLHSPLFHFENIEDLFTHLPHSCPLVGVELDDRSKPLGSFDHPQRAVYLLGAEDNGLPHKVLDRCHSLIQIEAVKPQSMNVAVAGSLVVYDRHMRLAA